MEEEASVVDKSKVTTRKNKKMGCGKFSLELIRDKKLRKETFRTKKAMLMKKSGELAALCDIPVCTVVFGEEPNSEPEYWPKNLDEVQRIINMYKSKKVRAKTVDLHDFYTIKNKKLEKQIARVRQQQILDRARNLPLDQLDEVLGSLDRNMEVLDNRIELITKEKSSSKRLRLIEDTEAPPPLRITNKIMHDDQFMYPTVMNPTVSDPSPLPPPPPQRFTTNKIMHNKQLLYPTVLIPTVSDPSPLPLPPLPPPPPPPPQRITTNILHNEQCFYPNELNPTEIDASAPPPPPPPPQRITTNNNILHPTYLNPMVSDPSCIMMGKARETMGERSATANKQQAEKAEHYKERPCEATKKLTNRCKDLDGLQKKMEEVVDAAEARGFKAGKKQAASELIFLQEMAFKRGWDEALKAAEVNSDSTLFLQHVPMKPMRDEDLEVPAVEEVTVVDPMASDAKVEGPSAELSVKENQIAVEDAALLLMMLSNQLGQPSPS